MARLLPVAGPARLALTLALTLTLAPRTAELALRLSLAALRWSAAATERLQLADGDIHRLEVGGTVDLRVGLLGGLLLGAQQLLQAGQGVVARSFEARFALDFLPVHLDRGDE